MNDLSLKLVQITALLKKEGLSKNDKIVMSFQILAGLDITKLDPVVKKHIHRHLVESNAILTQYPLRTFDDYTMISDIHKDKLIKNIRKLCNYLR